MASNPAQQCCAIGVKHEGEASGEIIDIEGISTYITYPKDKSSKNAVLYLPDVIGHRFINAQLIADQYAANGYLCVMPDLFHGDTVPLGPPAGFDIMEWFSKGDHGPSNVDPTVTTIIKHMRDQLHVANIGAVGYCFGAKYVARYLGAVGKEKGAMVDAGFMAHPSFVEAEEELEKIEGPLSIAAAENDTVFTVEKRHESERVLKGVSDGPRELPYQINLYGYVSHGFAVKGDPAVKRARFAKEQAFLQAVTWFDTWIKE